MFTPPSILGWGFCSDLTCPYTCCPLCQGPVSLLDELGQGRAHGAASLCAQCHALNVPALDSCSGRKGKSQTDRWF